jgi:hypothetical protein
MKLSPLILGVVIITILAVGGGVYFVTMQNGGDSSTAEVSTGEQADVGETKDACEAFTLDIAKTVLGEGVEKSDLPPGAQASTDDVSVTNCAYEVDSSSGFMSANALLRGAKAPGGIESNKFGFEGNQDRSNFEEAEIEYGPTEPINGLGDSAFYDPDFEQVNVLFGEGKYWLIVQADSRAQTEQLAELMTENL